MQETFSFKVKVDIVPVDEPCDLGQVEQEGDTAISELDAGHSANTLCHRLIAILILCNSLAGPE